MRRLLFNHLQKLSFRFYDNHKTGHLLSRISTDLWDIGEVAHHGPEDLFIALMTLVAAFVMMLTVHVQLAVLTFLVVPGMLWLGFHFNHKMTLAFRNMYGEIAEFNARVEDNIGGMRVVQAFANEEHENRLFAQNNMRFRRAKLQAYSIMAWSSSLSYILMRFVSLFVLLCGAWFIFRGELTHWRVRRLHPADEHPLPADREDQRGDRYLPQGHRRLQALPRGDGHRARGGGSARRDRGGATAGRDPLPRRDVQLRPASPGAAGYQPRHPPRRDGGLRRPIGRRQDHALQPAAALLRRGRRADHRGWLRHPLADAGLAAAARSGSCSRMSSSSSARFATISPTAIWMPASRRSGRRRGGRTSTPSSSRCRRAWTR